MRAQIYNLMYPLINNGSGIYELDDLEGYVDKLLKKACIISVTDQDVLQGFLAYYANDPEKRVGFLSMLVVLPSSQRMGYGRRMVEFCLTDLVHKGYKICRTEVRDNNIMAINICKRVGFSLTEKKEKYLVMEKVL
jgi:ribosomal protein S18 acetylase RimI-like enzyme